MSYVIAAPETMISAATDLAGIQSALSAAYATAATSTTQVLAAGADEVSVAIANVFGSYAREYAVLSTQAAEFHELFVRALSTAGGAYAAAEAANAAPLLQGLGQAASAPAQTIADVLFPNTALSVSGITLLQTGTAQASSGFGGLAFTMGANSSASAVGIGCFATAIGNGSTSATHGTSTLSAAIAIGNNNYASAAHGIGNAALIVGDGNWAAAGAYSEPGPNGGTGTGSGSFDLAAILFANQSKAFVTYGNFNLGAIVSGADNFVIAGASSTNQFVPADSGNFATIIAGTGNQAFASSYGHNFATVLGFLGNNLTAHAQGGGGFALAP